MPSSLPAALRALAVVLALFAGPAYAHEGHDHGAAPPPVTKSIAPRGEAASAVFELVAVLRDGMLSFYLDRFQTGEPIPGATLDVDTPSGTVTAQAAELGVYRLPAPWLRKLGHHDLMVTITAGSDVEVEGSHVRARVRRAGRAVPGLIRDLDQAGIGLESIEVHRPTLDDVFLTLTGRSLRDADAATEDPATEGGASQ